MRSILTIWILFLAVASAAQTPSATNAVVPAPEPNGIVTGRVFCGDTGRPARFASVSLKPVSDQDKTTLDKGVPSSRSKTAPAISTVTVAVDTALDGSYTLNHVAPGAYYVIVKKDGYINPIVMFSKKQLDKPTDQIRALIEQALPRVQIEQDSTAHADIQLQRGAVVSGTISYDDETPATGVAVTLLHKDENGKWIPVKTGMRDEGAVTNDRGYFRIASLLPDTYLLETTLNLGDEKISTTSTSQFYMTSFRSKISFYGNGTPSRDQAVSFTLRGSDERAGTDMILPISKLHKLTGRIAAGANGHFVNAGSVALISSSETEKRTIAGADIAREDGLFHFEFVPEGDYTLRVTNARDVTWEPPASQPGVAPNPFAPPDKERILETYGNVEMPLLLRGDMTGIIVTVPPGKNNKSAASN